MVGPKASIFLYILSMTRQAFPRMPAFHSLYRSPLCQTLSNASLTSMKASHGPFPLLLRYCIISWSRMSWSSVPLFLENPACSGQHLKVSFMRHQKQRTQPHGLQQQTKNSPRTPRRDAARNNSVWNRKTSTKILADSESKGETRKGNSRSDTEQANNWIQKAQQWLGSRRLSDAKMAGWPEASVHETTNLDKASGKKYKTPLQSLWNWNSKPYPPSSYLPEPGHFKKRPHTWTKENQPTDPPKTQRVVKQGKKKHPPWWKQMWRAQAHVACMPRGVLSPRFEDLYRNNDMSMPAKLTNAPMPQAHPTEATSKRSHKHTPKHNYSGIKCCMPVTQCRIVKCSPMVCGNAFSLSLSLRRFQSFYRVCPDRLLQTVRKSPGHRPQAFLLSFVIGYVAVVKKWDYFCLPFAKMIKWILYSIHTGPKGPAP